MIPRMPRKARQRKVSLFGQNLLRLRIALGMSQEALSERTGVSRSTIARIETGAVAGPSPGVSEVLARALGVKEGDLYDDRAETPGLEEALAAFASSPWAGTLRPPLCEVDLDHLRKLSGSIWIGMRPNPEALYHIVLAHRSGLGSK